VLLEVRGNAEAFDSLATSLPQISRCADSKLIHILIQQRQNLFLIPADRGVLVANRSKTGHGDLAQYPGENPPVGLILCNRKNAAVAHYALEGLSNKVMAAEYQMVLPDEATLAAELERTRKLLEHRLPKLEFDQ
jgi:hypothetical protein